jgi:hypothetical protein
MGGHFLRSSPFWATNLRGRRMTDRKPVYLSQSDLATRWNLSSRTLEAWRHKRIGPPYTQLGRSIRYLTRDIEQFEAEAKIEPHRGFSKGPQQG